MIEKITASKKLTILAVVVIVTAVLIYLSWDFFYNIPYYGYIEDIETFKSLNTVEYKFQVIRPAFLQAGGFLAVEWGDFSVTVDSNGKARPSEKPSITLFVWPSIIKEAEYGLSFDYQLEDGGYFDNSMIEFTANGDGTYNIKHNFESANAVAFMEEYKGVIDGMLRCAEQTWQFSGINDIKHGFEAREGVIARNLA